MRCRLCNAPLTGNLQLRDLGWGPYRDRHLCRRCLRTFAALNQHLTCPGCGRANDGTLCLDCQRWVAQGETLLQHQALFSYNAAMKAFIQQYKGLGDYRLHDAFSGLWPRWVRQWTLVPIVSEAGHLAGRGFDPVLGLFADLPLHPILQKAATDKPQAQKTRAERLQTPQSFSVVGSFSGMRQILLLDDLYTTGRTLYHARDALIAAGFQGKVQSFSLIR